MSTKNRNKYTLDEMIADLTKIREEKGNMSIVTGEGTEEPLDGEFGQLYFDVWHRPLVLTASSSEDADYVHTEGGSQNICVIHL